MLKVRKKDTTLYYQEFTLCTTADVVTAETFTNNGNW